MELFKNTYTLDETIDFAANSSRGIDLPESGYITELNITTTLNITAGTSVSAAEDAFSRVIKGAKITSGGAKNYFSISDGRQWYYWNYLNYQGRIYIDSLPSAGSTANATGTFVIHWGLDPYVESDRTIVLPCVELQNTRLELTWGSGSDLGTGYTINAASSSAQVEVTELVLGAGTLRTSIWETLIFPRFEAIVSPVTSTYSNLARMHNVPVGDALLQTVVLMLDSSGNRTNTYFTEVGVRFPKERRTPYHKSTTTFLNENYRRLRLLSRLTGAGMIKWSEITERERGIDLRGMSPGDVCTAYTVASANGTLHELHIMFG